MQEFSKQSGIDLHKNIVINSKSYPSILALVDKLDFYMNDMNEISLIHGDFCFSNIMYDFRGGAIKTFDQGDVILMEKLLLVGGGYDFAKLVHSVFGLYDFIIAGFFECKFNGNNIEFL